MDATLRPGMARLKTTHALLIAAGLMLHVTFAAGASDSVAITVDGRLKIESVVDAPSGCYAAGQATIGPPPGQIPVQDAVVVTYRLVYNKQPEQLCAQFIKPVAFSIVVDLPKTAQAIIIYTVDPGSNVTTARAVRLPER